MKEEKDKGRDMAKSHNQKAKILYLAQMLHETGENRVLSMPEILKRLAEYGIQAERKSIYDDIETLREFGMDVKFKRGRPGGYYLAEQPSEQLLPVCGRQESLPAEEVFIEEEVSEKYQDPLLKQEQKASEASAESTAGIAWNSGKSEAVGDKRMKLLCSSRLETEVRAFFGVNAEYREKGQGYFTVTTALLNDACFFGWLTAMGKDVHIVKPKKTAQAYRDYLRCLAKEYKTEK